MNTIEKSESTATAVALPGAHAATVQERIQELHQWREQIPHFAIPTTSDATRRLNSVASVTPEFIELTNVATANNLPLVRGASLTPDQVRDLVAYADAYAPLPDELEALAKFIRYSTTLARNTAAAEALTTYALAVRLSKRPDTAHLAPRVADMRRALGRGRKSSAETQAKKAAARAAKAAAKAAAGTTPTPPAIPAATPVPIHSSNE
jgi:hypothetical protein